MISPASSKRFETLRNDLANHLSSFVGANKSAANGRLEISVFLPFNSIKPAYRITLAGSAFADTTPISWNATNFKDALNAAEQDLRKKMADVTIGAELANALLDQFDGIKQRANALSEEYIQATFADLKESLLEEERPV